MPVTKYFARVWSSPKQKEQILFKCDPALQRPIRVGCCKSIIVNVVPPGPPVVPPGPPVVPPGPPVVPVVTITYVGLNASGNMAVIWNCDPSSLCLVEFIRNNPDGSELTLTITNQPLAASKEVVIGIDVIITPGSGYSYTAKVTPVDADGNPIGDTDSATTPPF